MLLPEKFNEQNSIELLESFLGKRDGRKLWDSFGNLGLIADSDIELIKRSVPSITETKVSHLKCAFKLAEQLYYEKRRNPQEIRCSYDLANIMRAEYSFNNEERLYLVAINDDSAFRGIELIATGDERHAIFNIRTALSVALRMDAHRVALVHNHPSGNLVPSQADLDATESFANLCEQVGIQFYDHLIMAPDLHDVGEDFISMRDLGYVGRKGFNRLPEPPSNPSLG